MANPFASSQSGMAAMLSKMVPPEIMEAIKNVSEQLPNVVTGVKSDIDGIKTDLKFLIAIEHENAGKLERLGEDMKQLITELELLKYKVDPDATPDHSL